MRLCWCHMGIVRWLEYPFSSPLLSPSPSSPLLSPSPSLLSFLLISLNIGLPPVLLFGSDHLKEKVSEDCLSGKKVICLCITEPHAGIPFPLLSSPFLFFPPLLLSSSLSYLLGSDVANLQSEAIKSEDRKHYIVNGQKKWITNISIILLLLLFLFFLFFLFFFSYFSFLLLIHRFRFV